MAAPNIVFILIDDMGWRDLSCYGSSFYETPRLDRLAAEGVRFTDAYATCPVCSPTRASVMSGKYPARVGVTNYIGGFNRGRLQEAPYLHYLPKTETSVASALREGGYQTWHVGKWHLGDEPFYPQHHGFDVNIAGCSWGHPQGGYFSPWKNPAMPDAEPGKYLTDHLTDRAMDLIRSRDRSRPFFLNFWHYAVHTPIQSPPALVEKYRQKARALRLDQKDPFVDGEEMPFLPKQAGRPRAHVRRRVLQSDPAYAAMMENLDTNIGRLLDLLETEGLTGNTLVVFTSDNGGLSTAEGSPTCNLPLAEGKGWDREGGTRVCQIARWPARVKPGQVTSVPVQSCDYYPTFLEAAGLPLRPAQHCDGLSFLPVMDGKSMPSRTLFWHYPHYPNQGGQPSAWVMREGWKLIHRYESKRDELFYLPTDVSEAVDLAEKHPEIVWELHAALEAWQREVEAKIPEADPEYERLAAMVPKIANNAHV